MGAVGVGSSLWGLGHEDNIPLSHARDGERERLGMALARATGEARRSKRRVCAQTGASVGNG